MRVAILITALLPIHGMTLVALCATDAGLAFNTRYPPALVLGAVVNNTSLSGAVSAAMRFGAPRFLIASTVLCGAMLGLWDLRKWMHRRTPRSRAPGAWSHGTGRNVPAAKCSILLSALVVPFLMQPVCILLAPIGAICWPWILVKVLNGADGEFYEDGGLIIAAYGWWCIANFVLLVLTVRWVPLPPTVADPSRQA